MANLFQPSITRAIDGDGNPISGAKMYFYTTGTTTLATVYTDQAGTTASPNPVIADSSGVYAPVFLNSGATYRVRFRDASDIEYAPDVDPVRGYDETVVSDYADAALVSQTAAAASQVATAADAVSTAADVVTTTADAVQTTADRASTTANAASAATSASAATVSSTIYADEATGRAAVADGAYYSAIGTTTAKAVDIWKRDSSSASTLQRTYPSSVALHDEMRRASQFISPDQITEGSALFYLESIELFLDVDGVRLAWPANLSIREIAADGSDRMRFRLGGGDTLDGDSAYPEIGSESTNGQLNRSYAGLVKDDLLPIYAVGTSLGVPANTHIGNYRINFDSTTFGTYYPFAIFPFTQGGLIRAVILPDETFTNNVKALVAEVRRETPTSSPWVSTVTDPYGIAFVQDVSIERGVPGRTYILRYRHDTAGSTRRLHMFLYDPIIAQDIAELRIENTSDFSSTLPEALFLTGVAAGTTSTYWTGTSATVWIDKAHIDFDSHITSTETSTALAGIKPDRVRTREQVAEMLQTGIGVQNHDIYVGPDAGHDYTSIKLAGESVLSNTSVARSGYPFSYFVTPSNQYAIKVPKGYTEEWVENAVDQGGGTLVGQGLILFEGLSLELSEESVFHTTGGSTYQGPLYEASYGGRIIGPASAKLQQRGEGYVGHIDSGNTLSKPASAGLSEQYWQLVFVYDGPETESTLSTHDEPLMGCGEADDQILLFKRGKMTRHASSTTTTGYFFSHTSASSVLPGRTVFDRMIFNDDIVTTAPAISLAKDSGGRDDAQTVRHELEVINSKIARISSDDKWRAVGTVSGATVTPTGVLD